VPHRNWELTTDDFQRDREKKQPKCCARAPLKGPWNGTGRRASELGCFRKILDSTLFDIGNESVSIQLAQCWFPGVAVSNAKMQIYFFRIKYTEAILSNSTRKLMWFAITKMPIAV